MLERPWQYPPSEPPTPTSQEQKGGALRGSWRKAAAAGLCALKLEALRGQGGEHSSTEPPSINKPPCSSYLGSTGSTVSGTTSVWGVDL